MSTSIYCMRNPGHDKKLVISIRHSLVSFICRRIKISPLLSLVA